MSMVRSPAAIADSLVERWSPRAVAEVDDGCETVAKVHGTLAWHAPWSTQHTGSERMEKTRSVDEQLRPLLGPEVGPW